MKKKNNMVELCRFLACYVIFSYHAGGRFTTGWIFVEFFFMLSGYFAIKHLVRMEGKIENKATYPISIRSTNSSVYCRIRPWDLWQTA